MTQQKPSTQSKALFEQARKVIAGGVVSINRLVDPEIAFTRASGSRIYDADGNEFIDYHAAFAPHILGHNDPEVNAAAANACESGWSLMGSGTTTWEIELAELLQECVPSLELLQITNTGSEATAHAIRLSRAYTRRDDIVVMLGGYNGSHNDVARTVMPGIAAVGKRISRGEYAFLPLSAGIPESVGANVHVVNFNDVGSLEYVLRKFKVACVLTEPVLQNIGVVLPNPGYLEVVRELCTQTGTVLAFDEVKTGFRAALGGYQSIAGVVPDLSVFGKAVANGYPMGVIGGNRDIMSLFADPDPKRRVLIAGTYNAHPMTCAAAIATLKRLSRENGRVYVDLDRKAGELQAGLERVFDAAGVTATVCRAGSAFCIYFMDHAPVDWHDIAENHDFAYDARFRRALIERGIYHFPLPCKQGSVSAAHSDEDIAATLDQTRDAVATLAAAG